MEKPANSGFLPTISVDNSVDNVDLPVGIELYIQVTVYSARVGRNGSVDILRNYENDACLIGFSMIYCI